MTTTTIVTNGRHLLNLRHRIIHGRVIDRIANLGLTMAQNSFNVDGADGGENEEKVVHKIRNYTDIQKLKLEKLMKNPVSLIPAKNKFSFF